MNHLLLSLGSLILPIFGFLIALLVTGVGLALFALFAWHGQALYSWAVQQPVLGAFLNGIVSLSGLNVAHSDAPSPVHFLHDALLGMLTVASALLVLMLALRLLSCTISALTTAFLSFGQRAATLLRGKADTDG